MSGKWRNRSLASWKRRPNNAGPLILQRWILAQPKSLKHNRHLFALPQLRAQLLSRAKLCPCQRLLQCRRLRPLQTLSLVLKHLRKLEDARLIRSEKQGRSRIVHIEAQPLRQAEDWLIDQRQRWERRIDRLQALAEGMKGPRQ